MSADPTARPLELVHDQLVAAAHRQARPLDNLGRPYTLADGRRCLDCGWWGYTMHWGERADCPNCCADEPAVVDERRWVRTGG